MIDFELPPNFYENLRIICLTLISFIPGWLEYPTDKPKISVLSNSLHKYTRNSKPPDHIARY